MEKLVTKIIKKTILVFILGLIYSCHTKVNKNSIADTIITFYENKKEISKTNVKNLKNDFEGLTHITGILNNEKFNYNDGVYLVRLNISHTTSAILLMKRNNYKIISLTGDTQKIIDSLIKDMKIMELYNENDKEKYIRIISETVDDNNRVLEKQTLLPL